MDEGNETTYYLSDGRGSVTALLKEGCITDRYHYDAYGNLLKKAGSTENEYLYNGESYSETTGLYYQRARYMNPTTGTFISMDAYNGTTDNPVSQHKYLYANANPVMYEDPSGYSSMLESLMSMSMSQILIGCSMIGSVFGYADAVLSGENVLVGILKGALAGFTIGWGLYAIAQQAVIQLIVSGLFNIVQAYNYINDALDALQSGNSLVANLRMMIAALSGVIGAYAVGEGIVGIVNFIRNGGSADSIREMGNWVNEAADDEDSVPSIGFDTFDKLKRFLGSAGEGNAWHHIVEQSQINSSGFAANAVHNVNNIISIPNGAGSVHAQISGYYSSIPASGATNGLTVRQWLSGQSFEQQFEFGIDILRRYGEVIETSTGWIFVNF